MDIEQYLSQKTKIYDIPVGELIPYENNPRLNDEAVPALVQSIKRFGFKVPLVVGTDMVIAAGHTRLKAAKRLGMKTVPCIMADDLSDAEINAFRLADNKVGEIAEWDEQALLRELQKIAEDETAFSMTDFGFDDIETMLAELADDDSAINDLRDYSGSGNVGSLCDDFIAPPFSCLDARQGYWQERKRAWKALGLRSEVGRDDGLLGDGLKELAAASGANLTGTSIFDPVLCEIIYRWFCPDNGTVFDCFAGGSVRGVVAGYLGYDYTGIELREEQVEANRENAAEIGTPATWYCDDSQNADKYVEDNSFDLVFSCPPYADLEVYSDDPRDLSTMKYDDFLKVYANIIAIALRKLKNDRFAVFVVGDVRDENGFYRDFVSDTIRIFTQNGVKLYNQIILIEQLATAPLRARRQFNGLRKVVKCHQNVLVFYKGNPKAIRDNYGEVEVADLDINVDETE